MGLGRYKVLGYDSPDQAPTHPQSHLLFVKSIVYVIQEEDWGQKVPRIMGN